MRAQDIMMPCTVACTQHTTLRDAAQLMLENQCGFLPVAHENDPAGTIIGVISERDLVCRVVVEGLDPLMSTVWLAMAMPAETIHEDATVDECLLRLRHQRTDHLVVVDQHGRYCGLINQGDIARQRPAAKSMPGGDAPADMAGEAGGRWTADATRVMSRSRSGRMATSS